MTANTGFKSTSDRTISVFGGYNRNLRIADGEFYDMNGLTSSYYPLLATRHRGAQFSGAPSGAANIFAKEKLIYIANNIVYYGGAAVPGLRLTTYQKERTLISMGAYLLIFPDKKYLNTNNIADYGDMGASFSTAAGATVTYTLCTEDGGGYADYSVSDTAPDPPADGSLWLDTSATPLTLKRYSTYSGSWTPIFSTFVKIAYPNIGKAFSQYDGVKISGSADGQFNTTMALWAVGDDYIVVSGIIDGTFTQTTRLKLEREIPDMEFFCEGENRVWGCNSAKNEIYACKLGDFKNWNCFMGLSTDSYAVSVGTDGDFTGAIRYLSSVLFFKENWIHKIYNTNPPFQVSTSAMKGVQKGSHRSLCVVNRVLYYLSPTGICRYEGSLSSPVEEIFGTAYYHSGIAGEFRNKYYICVTSGTVDKTIFVYDTARGLWHKEAAFGGSYNVYEYAAHNSNLYYILGGRGIFLLDAQQPYGAFTGQLAGYDVEGAVSWYAETGLLGLDYAGHKYIKAVTVRLSLEQGGSARLYVEYDSSGQWELLDEVTAQNTHGFTVRGNIPCRCDHMRLRIEGFGECRVYSMTLQIEEGSERG